MKFLLETILCQAKSKILNFNLIRVVNRGLITEGCARELSVRKVTKKKTMFGENGCCVYEDVFWMEVAEPSFSKLRFGNELNATLELTMLTMRNAVNNSMVRNYLTFFSYESVFTQLSQFSHVTKISVI